jgi:hypothetical protein
VGLDVTLVAMSSGKLYTWGIGSDYFVNKDILKIE